MSEEENNTETVEEQPEAVEEEPELTADQMEAAQRMYLSEIMRQLSDSERFQRFFEINYDVQTFFDKEKHTFDIRLIELPPVLASERLKELASKHAEEHLPQVQTASLADIAALNEVEKRDPDFGKK
jgi:hypothetical protein